MLSASHRCNSCTDNCGYKHRNGNFEVNNQVQAHFILYKNEHLTKSLIKWLTIDNTLAFNLETKATAEDFM